VIYHYKIKDLSNNKFICALEFKWGTHISVIATSGTEINKLNKAISNKIIIFHYNFKDPTNTILRYFIINFFYDAWSYSLTKFFKKRFAELHIICYGWYAKFL